MNKEERKVNTARKIDNVLFKYLWVLIILVVLAVGLVARYAVVRYSTNDISGIVFNWMDQIRGLGFKNMWQVKADYSPLYIFMIALFTLLPDGPKVTEYGQAYYLYDMYYLKTVQFVFDILLAFGIFFVIHRITKNKWLSTIGFAISFLLPVQAVNSGMWGQCDGFYTCMFVWAIYLIMARKSWAGNILVGLALAVKLQAVFILPLLVYLWVKRKTHIWDLLFMAIGFFVTFIPYWILGSGFLTPFKFISAQVGGYSNLTLGAGSIWHLFEYRHYPSNVPLLSRFALFIGLGLIGIFFIIIFARRIKLNNEAIITVGTFLIGIVPFFLPHMHERYFYALDVLVVAYCLVRKKHYYLIPLMQVSSGIAYYHYLSGKYFIEALGEDSVHLCTFINLAVLIVLFIDIMKLERLPAGVTDREYNQELKLTEGIKKEQ